ncbi:Bax inhibitor-1/YccA family protein [Microbacterium xanthum]|uniref:Bax inhibitor-1/YccA family protein n=1 Tax=Microbacterium xanthum TaxID=3079794 RepID=UPI002AD2579D|nr:MULTISPECIES: Bax inhibitor-1/YccA family protein [unclassified Microbacterium]MDZ8170887.1 Bax inhibitor-1/YccA family protein [Microbacterium sp. KSW-48]MDZ8201404.1 Bax inhibitor-1/YccA family protein [Microbacterium sp. SSW1-59]
MALNNPAFNNPAFQDARAVQSYPGGANAANLGGATSTAQRAGTDAAAQAHLEGMYAAPPAGSSDTGRMTVEDTVAKTVGLFAILLVGAVAGWLWTMSPVTAQNPVPTALPMIVGGLVGFVLSLVVIFTSRKKVRPGLIFAYAAAEGLFVGGISAFFEFIYPGIVTQATLGTLVVVGVTLALFASGKIRASKRATKIFLIAMVGYLVFSLVNVGLMLFGVTDSAFGLRSEVQIFGIPLGVIIGLLVVVMAAYSLVLDFDQIQQGVRNGAPRQMGWLGGFGIMVTVVWLYVEILRIIAIVRGGE